MNVRFAGEVSIIFFSLRTESVLFPFRAARSPRAPLRSETARAGGYFLFCAGVHNHAVGVCSLNAHSATPSTLLLIAPQLQTGTPTLDEPAFDGDFCEVASTEAMPDSTVMLTYYGS